MIKIISITVDTSKVLAKFEKIDREIAGRINDAVFVAGQFVRNEVAKSMNMGNYGVAPSWDTGKLASKVEVYRVNLGQVVVTNNLDYAIFIEKGTRPHWIGAPVNIKRVGWRYIGMHPGTTAHPHFETIGENVYVQQEVANIINNKIKDLIA